jgi:trk system potassium uptake protein TrkH
MTLTIELAGAIAIYIGTQRVDPSRAGVFDSVFHAVSAFCNAGFAIRSENAMAWRSSWIVMWTLMILITLGGLGYAVLQEIIDRLVTALRRRRHSPVVWSLNARVVLAASAVLTLGGAIAIGLCGLTADEDNWGERVLHALFQSVTARTAGFNTVRIELLPVVTLLVICSLMYIGGSPGSTAGGIKTTSATVAVANAAAGVLGRSHVSLFGRRLPPDVLQRAVLVIVLATAWQALGIFILTLTENVPHGARFEQVIFEQVSAFNTVGLSADLTPRLSDAGKLWVILTMFVGRVGPLTIGLAVLRRKARHFEYPVERVMIG